MRLINSLQFQLTANMVLCNNLLIRFNIGLGLTINYNVLNINLLLSTCHSKMINESIVTNIIMIRNYTLTKKSIVRGIAKLS